MSTTAFTSQELNQTPGRARKAARQGPVFITEHGEPTHVLLSIEEYERLTGQHGGSVFVSSPGEAP